VSDRLFIRHPDDPARNGYVSQAAFDALWSKKGYVIESAVDATVEDLNTELDRRAGLTEPASAPEAPQEPTEPDPAPEPPVDEEAELRAFLEAHDVVVDGRWRLKRLRTEAAVFAEDPA
jgi:hypothetical protein